MIEEFFRNVKLSVIIASSGSSVWEIRKILKQPKGEH